MLGSGIPCSGRERGGVAPPSQGLAVLRQGGQRWLGVGGTPGHSHELFAFTGQGCSGAVYFCPAQRGMCVIYEAF